VDGLPEPIRPLAGPLAGIAAERGARQFGGRSRVCHSARGTGALLSTGACGRRSRKSAASRLASNRAPTAAWRAMPSASTLTIGTCCARLKSGCCAAPRMRRRPRKSALEPLPPNWTAPPNWTTWHASTPADSRRAGRRPGGAASGAGDLRAAHSQESRAGRDAALDPALGALESPWCESCFGRAHPLFLCDERVHFLCKSLPDGVSQLRQAVLPRVSAQVPVRHRPSPGK